MGFLVLLRTRIANRSAQVGLILTPWGVAKKLILSRLWKTDLSNQGLESWIRVQLLEFDALLEVIDQRRTALTARLSQKIQCSLIISPSGPCGHFFSDRHV
jgi:hypothetical protein